MFSSCLTVKGIEPRERDITKLQGSRYRKMMLQMWVPTNSLVVKLPDMEVTGTCLVPPVENDDQNTRVIYEPQEPRCSCAPAVSELCLEKHCSNISPGREYADEINDKTIKGNVLSLLESSLDKELSLDHTDVIPSQLRRRSNTSPRPSTQFGNRSPSPYLGYSRPHPTQDHILPKDLKFGIRNVTQYRKTTRRQGVAIEERPKIVPSFCRGNLEPLLLRTKPAKNLHEELEREEMEGTVLLRE